MNKKRLLKLADFIEKLPPRKLDMMHISDLNGAEVMNYRECTSVACAMGWTPAVFPKLVQWKYDYNSPDVVDKHGNSNEDAVATLFDIKVCDMEILFGCGTPRYHTPKQVAAGLREYVKTGVVPKRCIPVG